MAFRPLKGCSPHPDGPVLSGSLVHHYLSRSARLYPEKCALVSGKERWSYARLEQVTNSISESLSSLGLQRHDMVVILLDSCPEAVLGMYSVLKAGATFVMLDGGIKPPKLAYILEDAEPVFLIAHIEKEKVVREALSRSSSRARVIWVGQRPESDAVTSSLRWDQLLDGGHICNQGGEVIPEAPREIIDQDLAALIYTSGSTGEPKGIMSSHMNMVSAARSIIQYLENRFDDVVLVSLPLSFDYGLYQVVMTFMFGGTVVLERSFLYPVKILETIERERVTGFPLVPTIVALLLRMTDLQRYDLGSLRYMTNTGAALPVEHIKKLREFFPWVRLYSMFGLTECKRVCFLPPEELDRRPGSVGKAMPNCETFIVDDQGREVGPGETGELVVRGSNVMRGYWNSPELTERTFRPWRFPGEKVLFTGDFFRKDEGGFLYFLGRKDDMLKIKGERVSPKEIESVLCSLKGISRAAVIGIDDEVAGKSLAVFVVLEKECGLSKMDILKYCSQNLEVPIQAGRIRILKDLPTNPNGKVDAARLKEMLKVS